MGNKCQLKKAATRDVSSYPRTRGPIVNSMSKTYLTHHLPTGNVSSSLINRTSNHALHNTSTRKGNEHATDNSDHTQPTATAYHIQASKRLQSRRSVTQYVLEASTRMDIAIAQKSSPHLASQHHRMRPAVSIPRANGFARLLHPERARCIGRRSGKHAGTLAQHAREGKHFRCITALQESRQPADRPRRPSRPASQPAVKKRFPRRPRPKRSSRLWRRMQDSQV